MQVDGIYLRVLGGVREHQARCTGARGAVCVGADVGIGTRVKICKSALGMISKRARHGLRVLEGTCAFAWTE